MSKFNHIQTNFATGEISPKSLGRIDFEELNGACELMSNFLPLKSGGASKRPGSRYVANLSAFTDPALLPFVASKELGYVVALDPTRSAGAGNVFCRIYKADGTEMVVNEAPFTGIAGSFALLPTDIDPRQFVSVQFADGLFVVHTSNRYPPFVITRLTETTFVINAYFLINPYNDAEIDNILKIPYRNSNIGPITITPSATSGNITLTASASFFNVGQIGTLIKLTQSGSTGVARITGFTSDTVVSATVVLVFSTTGATTDWEEGAWSDYRGWPGSIAVYEQSMYFGGNTSEPDTVWKSLTGNVFHMMAKRLAQDSTTDNSGVNYFGPLAITDPAGFIIAAQEVNRISWLNPTSVLAIGTLSTEYTGGGADQILSNESVGFRAQTNYGSDGQKTVKVSNEILYISRDGRRLRNFKFSNQNGSHISIDLSILADHMTRIGGKQYGFIDMTYQQTRDAVWLINKNERLIAFTYQLDTRTIGWSQHTITNSLGIKGMCVIPNLDGAADDLFIVVKRTIDGNTVYYLETIVNDFDADSLNNTPVVEEDIPMFLDSSVTRVVTNPAGESTITVLDHLEGEIVTVTKDGFLLGDFTVAANEIDLGQTYPQDTRFVVGYKYTGEINTVDLEAGEDFGTAQGSIQRIHEVIFKLFKTFDLKFGRVDGNKLEPLVFSGGDIFTGDLRRHFTGEFDMKQAVRIVSEEPYPCTILTLTAKGHTND